MLSSAEVIQWFRPWINFFVDGFDWNRFPPGATVTSWYRQRRYWGDESQHRVALAFDIVPPTAEVQAWAERSIFYVIRESDHIHVQMLRAGRLRELGLDFSLIP